MNTIKKKILITGAAGFIGTNAVNNLSRAGYEIVAIDNFYRSESKKNIEMINKHENVKFLELSITDYESVSKIIRENNFYAVLNLAGQVAMLDSIQNPINDFEINTTGSLNVLDSLRKYSHETIYIYTSTNKVYGNLEWDIVSELETRFESVNNKKGYSNKLSINLSSPYGCSKGAADFYALDYFKTFGIKTIVLRLSSIYGQHQTSTYNQGWIGWFINQCINKSTQIEISGNGKQVRDILYVDDLTNLFQNILEKQDHQEFGKAYNVGGGYENSFSILELINFIQKEFNYEVKKIKNLTERIGDQKYFVSDNLELINSYEWEVSTDKHTGIIDYHNWMVRD